MTGGIALCGGACEHQPGSIEPLAGHLVGDRTIELYITCAVDGETTVDVAENADEVTIDVTGTPINGDCLPFETVVLDQPLGDRVIVVNGQQWGPLPPDCVGEFGRPDIGNFLSSCDHK